uniref:Pleckstrin homology domain containing, family G (with RhoGef domain) member 7 n=1 Tax=Cyprinus carpio TaxID=7962 RepID=A0A8C2AJE0_CYPCA
MGHSELGAAENPKAYRKQEAIWELFTSECVYFLDQLMVLKEVFLTTLTDLQMRECLQDIDSWRLFANLNELCLVSFGFLTSFLRVIKEMWTNPDSYSTQSLLELLRKAFGESICHCLQKYCLNYSTAILYLDSLKLREDFGFFLKVTVANVIRQCKSRLDDLEGKVKWLDNYQKVKQLKEALVWLPVWEQDKRAHVPEVYRLCRVCLHNLLLHTENAKMHEVYLFLFDQFLLITKIKRSKKKSGVVELNPLRLAAGQELEFLLQESCSLIVLDQPISLDRLQLKNIDQLNATASGLPNSFIVMHQNRYQQCIGVFILQAQTESVKKAWVSEIEDAISSLLKQDSQQPRLKNSFLESTQI